MNDMLDLNLHHIGVASPDIVKEERIFSSLGYTPCSETFSDPFQRIRGRFIAAPHQPMLELLENIDPNSQPGRLGTFLKHGIKFYHFAYETCSIEADAERLQSICKAKIIVPVMDAVFFEKICFAVLPNQMIVELVQINGINQY